MDDGGNYMLHVLAPDSGGHPSWADVYQPCSLDGNPITPAHPLYGSLDVFVVKGSAETYCNNILTYGEYNGLSTHIGTWERLEFTITNVQDFWNFDLATSDVGSEYYADNAYLGRTAPLPAAAVPEPGTLALLIGCCMPAALLLRRRGRTSEGAA